MGNTQGGKEVNHKDKTAIENLIIIGRYMQENSILTTEDADLLEKSIQRAQRLIGVRVDPTMEELELGDITGIDVEAYIKALKNRKKS